jgi:hypothetical protein
MIPISKEKRESFYRKPTIFIYLFFVALERVGHSFAYVSHFVFLRDVWIRTQRAVVASMGALPT